MFSPRPNQVEITVDLLADVISAKLARKILLVALACVMVFTYIRILLDVLYPASVAEIPQPLPFPGSGGHHAA